MLSSCKFIDCVDGSFLKKDVLEWHWNKLNKCRFCEFINCTTDAQQSSHVYADIILSTWSIKVQIQLNRPLITLINSASMVNIFIAL